MATRRVCIVGAGAIGGLIGARLARAGASVSALARGATAAALRAHGLRLDEGGERFAAPVEVAEQAARLGPQDVVVIAIKAPSLAEVAASVPPLLGPDTVVVTAMNGVPWWFFDGFGGEHAGMRLAAVDPDGRIAAAIPTRAVIGCVVHLTASVAEPGLVRHGFGNRLIVGEPAGGEPERLRALAALLRSGGFEAELSPQIQVPTWYKLWGNMTMNPVSALTGATTDRILDDPLVNRFCVQVMAEAAAIGARIGCPIDQTGEERNAVTRKLGPFKTSMLQDVEAGKPLEIDALLTVVQEIGARTGVPTPSTDALLGLTRLFARGRGLY